MYGQAFQVLSSVLGALPFLPRGKGALILILGGMVLLGVSLLWSFLAPARRPSPPGDNRVRSFPAGPQAGALMPNAPVTAATSAVAHQRAPWIRAVIGTASRADLGRPELLPSGPGRQVIRLSNCLSCRGRRRGFGCEHERGMLERVLQAFVPRGRVVEIACNPGSTGSCIFELRAGTSAA